MNKLSILFIFCLLILACNNESETKSDTENEELLKLAENIKEALNETEKKPEKETDEKKELSWEEKWIEERLPVLEEYGIKTRKPEEILSEIFNDRYTVKKPDTIQLTAKKCSFEPSMLVVDDHKLHFFNSNNDSLYTLDTKLLIHTAAWSPFNAKELFVLVKVNKRTVEHINYYDLKLYKLNFETQLLSQISYLKDKTVLLNKLWYELDQYFPRTSPLKIDESKQLIYFDCLALRPVPDGVENNGTCIFNLKNNLTILNDTVSFRGNNLKGEENRLYSSFYYNESHFETVQQNGYLIFSKLPKNMPKVKIPLTFLNNELINIPTSYDTPKLESLEYSFHYVTNNEKIIFSPFKEEEMGQQFGNIYLMDSDGSNARMLLKDKVAGYFMYLRELKNGNYIITDDESCLYLYNPDFNLISSFNRLHTYEIQR